MGYENYLIIVFEHKLQQAKLEAAYYTVGHIIIDLTDVLRRKVMHKILVQLDLIIN